MTAAPVLTQAPVMTAAPVLAPLMTATISPVSGAPETAVEAAAPLAAPVAASFVLPMDELQRIAEVSGLQWINSDRDKMRATQQAMAAEPAAAHVPRERKPVLLADDGPLVLVETRKNLSQLKLPFETAAASDAPQA